MSYATKQSCYGILLLLWMASKSDEDNLSNYIEWSLQKEKILNENLNTVQVFKEYPKMKYNHVTSPRIALIQRISDWIFFFML